MASYSKRDGGWRVQVRRKGISKSASFATKSEAVAWAAQVEADILGGRLGRVPDKTFGDLLARYRDEVSVGKRGRQWEQVRLDRIIRSDPIAAVALADLSATDVAAWRDRRLREVTPASVRREWTLLSHACSVAVAEWLWLLAHPMTSVRRPPPARARDRLFTDDEINRLLFALGYWHDRPPTTETARVGAALLFALETAMRAGEICALRWSDVDVAGAYLRITGEAVGGGKTAAARREVPLSVEALRLLDQVREGDGSVFRISSTQTLDALFRRAKGRAIVEGLHFHDSRATAITRLATRLEILALARMVGHRDLRQLQVYYRESATDMAPRLG